MKRYASLFWVSLFTVIFATTVIAGPAGLNKEEAEQLIKGNTAIGTNKWSKKVFWFFEESGNLKIRVGQGKRGGPAKWSLDDKGRLCFQDNHMNKESCQAIKPVDGGYEVPFDAEWKWEKVVPGNPHNL